MNFERVIQDDRAVSPVIGVILMVAITVILAAVIGTFVLGLSDQMGDTSPRATFSIGTAGNVNTVEIAHETGATIDADQMSIVSTTDFNHDGDGGTATSNAKWSNFTGAPTDVSAGDSVTITSASGFADQTVRVVYTNPDSGDSTTLQKKEIS